MKHILVTRDAALLKSAPVYFHRGQSSAFKSMLATEEENWDAELRRKEDANDAISSFEEFRKVGAAGF